ncbi:MAG: hypothetical protein V4616_03760 [Bacteroidota bacterium]
MQELKEWIVSDNGKDHIGKVAASLGNDAEKFSALIAIILQNQPKYAQKAAWVMEHCCNQYPQLADPHISALLELCPKDVHPGVRRAILHVLEKRPMNEDQTGIALEMAFEFLQAADELVAAKSYAMGMIMHLSAEYPELRNELKLHLEAQLPHQSPAFKSKAVKILTALNKKKS